MTGLKPSLAENRFAGHLAPNPAVRGEMARNDVVLPAHDHTAPSHPCQTPKLPLRFSRSKFQNLSRGFRGFVWIFLW